MKMGEKILMSKMEMCEKILIGKAFQKNNTRFIGNYEKSDVHFVIFLFADQKIFFRVLLVDIEKYQET